MKYIKKDKAELISELKEIKLELDQIKQSEFDLKKQLNDLKVINSNLKKSEIKCKSHFDKIKNGFALGKMIFDKSGKPIDYIFLNVNRTYEIQTGLKKRNIIGKKVSEVIPGIINDPSNLIETYGNVVLTGKSINFDDYSESLKKWFSIIAYRHKIGQFAIVVQDITESKQSEIIILENNRKNKAILSAIPEMMFIISKDGTYLDFKANKDNNDLFVPLENLIGTNLSDIGLPDNLTQLFLNKIQDTLSTGKINNISYKINKNKTTNFYEARIVKFSNEKVLATVRNMNLQKQYENKLKESEKKFRSLIENQDEGIGLVDLKENFIFVNSAAEKIFGVSKGKLVGRNLSEFVDKDTYNYILEQTKLREKGHVGKYEIEINDNNGDKKHLLVTTTPQFDENNNLKETMGIFRDFTLQKKLEASLRQSQKMEAIGTLAGGIAHDFNNVLYAMIGFTELALEDTIEGSNVNDNLKEILKGEMRAKEMVQQILTFSRQTEIEKKPLKLQPIIFEAIKFLKHSIPATIEIEYYIDNNCGWILADSTQLHQIIMNLATNASHAMEKKGGILKLTLKEVEQIDDENAYENLKSNYIKLSVSDTGHGMSEEIINKIYEPYFTTKEQGKGTGMGLAMVYGIIKDYEGIIKVKSIINKGTVFDIYIPLISLKGE